jgi:hypothetical protein
MFAGLMTNVWTYHASYNLQYLVLNLLFSQSLKGRFASIFIHDY